VACERCNQRGRHCGHRRGGQPVLTQCVHKFWMARRRPRTWWVYHTVSLPSLLPMPPPNHPYPTPSVQNKKKRPTSLIGGERPAAGNGCECEGESMGENAGLRRCRWIEVKVAVVKPWLGPAWAFTMDSMTQTMVMNNKNQWSMSHL
jgi:hypothetical protein